MKQLRYVVVALFAALALGAFGASVASAEVPEILPNPTAAEPAVLTGSGGAGKLVTKKAEIACTSFTAEVSFTSARKGSGTVKFKGCKSKKVACKTAGAAAEEIVVPVNVELVDIEGNSLLLLGTLFSLASELTITCTGFEIKVKGAVIGESSTEMFAAGTVGLVLVTSATLTFSATGEKQAIKTCKLTKATCEGKTYNLEANFSEGFEEAGLTQTAEVKSAKTLHFDY